MMPPTPFALRDSLERRFDGPIPPADPSVQPLDSAARARLFQRLAREAREQVAHRRARLAGAAALADQRLDRLRRDLNAYRSAGLGWLRP